MKLKLTAFICLMFCASMTDAANQTQISRYITVSNKPVISQINLLSQTVQIRFPESIQTVGDAMKYLLKFSGYSLIAEDKMQPAFKTTLLKPLPIIDRAIGPESTTDALITLAGPAFFLVNDPVNRTVNFKLKKFYVKKYYS